MGFCAGPFVLCKDGCCHQRRRNTNFGLEKFFSRKNFPPHMCSQNDECNVGIILSHVCWGRTPPPPAQQVGLPQPKPPSRHGDQGGEGGGWANGLPCHPPPPQSNFLPAKGLDKTPMGSCIYRLYGIYRGMLAKPMAACHDKRHDSGCPLFPQAPQPRKRSPKQTYVAASFVQ